MTIAVDMGRKATKTTTKSRGIWSESILFTEYSIKIRMDLKLKITTTHPKIEMDSFNW